jgi:3-carboxy-cis,cis-muconate cycloisomerase
MFPATSKIFAPLFRDEAITAVFADAQFLHNMLHVEASLAQVQAQLGIIPADAATKIAEAVARFEIDWAQLQTDTDKAGVPVIGLVKQLRQQVGGEAASFVHWGATTQDVMDTAVILQIRAALDYMQPSLHQLSQQLAQLADRHRHTLMAGRTHSQQALPITFGLKVAGWLAPLLRHWQRLEELKPRLLVLQFGGAAGTLASLGQMGTAVQQALAAELNLALLPLPWHTQRDNLAEIANWLSLVTGSLGKMGQDIILLAQTEIGELRETADVTRGGSSTMPQKSNPIISETLIAAARANANLLATMHQALIQEQERATHGWQLEWLTLPQMFGHTAVALQKALFLSQNLVVNAAQMRENIARGNGLMMAEAITFALAQHMNRSEAKQRVGEAVQVALAQNQHLVDVVQTKTAVPLDWDSLRDESSYLGTTQIFIDQVLLETKDLIASSPRDKSQG